MNVINDAKELRPGGRKVCVCIGFFDGVHLGHQQIIRQTVTDARNHDALAVVVTFDRHPSAVVAPERTPPLIYSLASKLKTISTFGADTTWLIEFNQAFSQIPAEQFIHDMVNDFGKVHSICVGASFVFGHKRGGNVAVLKKLGQELGFLVHGIASVSLDGQAVSSTRIREAIRSGDFDAASQMLGRAYSLSGKVIRGDRLGHQLGFPTANIDTAGLVLPPHGVYVAHATVHGKAMRAVLNIGRRPTVQNPTPELRVEVHLLDFPGGDLYGQEMEIMFAAKLRDEQKFASLEELKAQIARDIDEARRRF